MAKRQEFTSEQQSVRVLKVGERVRHILSELLARQEVHDEVVSASNIAVTEVRMSPDLRNATVFVTPLGGGDASALVKALQRNRKELRHIVTKSVQLKYSPDLKFVADMSYDQMDATRALLQSDAVQRDLGSDDGASAE